MAFGIPRTSVLAAGALALALGLTGCGGSGSKDPGVAGGGNKTTNSSTTGGGSTRADALKYSQCMRSHGVGNFPDPNAQGQIWLGSGGSKQIDPSSPQFKSAQDACKSLAPGGSPSQQNSDKATALKYAQCMRSHGVPSFPDPRPDGGIQVENGQIDPASPAFKAAEKACVNFQPGGPNAPHGNIPMGPGGGGK